MFFLMSIILSFHINLGAVVYLMHIKYKTHTLFDNYRELHYSAMLIKGLNNAKPLIRNFHG